LVTAPKNLLIPIAIPILDKVRALGYNTWNAMGQKLYQHDFGNCRKARSIRRRLVGGRVVKKEGNE
jgi:hypothetical protein